MASESLFTKCKICEKDISKTAKTCPHCGEKHKKLSFFHWMGILFLTFIVIGLINAPEQPKQFETSLSKVSTLEQYKEEIVVPKEEAMFIDTVEKHVNTYRNAKNKLQQFSLRELRKNEIEKSLKALSISSWVGKISQLETNTEGKAVLSIQISPDIEIKTWNNSFSDIGSNTLISKGTVVYKSLFNLTHGQQVEFSGSFIGSNLDYIHETSMTIQGSMEKPEFLFKFQSIKPLN